VFFSEDVEKERSVDLMLRRKKWMILPLLGVLMCISTGCGKDEKEETPTEGPERKVDVRAKNACERMVKKFLDAAAAKDYELALEYVDVEEMVRKGRQQAATSTATPPSDAHLMKEKLILMLEKSAERMAGLSYKIAGSEISGDQAFVEFEAYRDGKLVHHGKLALTKSDGKWKLSGSAIPAILPRGGPKPSGRPNQ
jgi:hypothetical protein